MKAEIGVCGMKVYMCSVQAEGEKVSMLVG